MNRKATSLLAALKNVLDFGAKYTPSFPVGSAGAKQLAVIKDFVDQENDLGSDQSAGANEIRAGILSKAVARHHLHTDMIDINRVAHSLSLLGTAGIAGKFNMPHHNGAQAYINAARAFAQEAAPYAAQMIELGLLPDFIAHLEADVTLYESTISAKASGQVKEVGATHGIATTAHDATVALHILDTIVRNIFKNDPVKLAEWICASHVERHTPVPKQSPAPSTTPQ